jgi:hypothetical protein
MVCTTDATVPNTISQKPTDVGSKSRHARKAKMPVLMAKPSQRRRESHPGRELRSSIACLLAAGEGLLQCAQTPNRARLDLVLVGHAGELLI